MSSSLTNETEMGPGSIFAKESTVREEGKRGVSIGLRLKTKFWCNVTRLRTDRLSAERTERGWCSILLLPPL